MGSLSTALGAHGAPTCELDVELVLGLEDLHVEGAVGGEVLDGPGPQDGLVVLGAERVWSALGGGRGWGRGGALTAAVRSTSFRLLRMKQASPLSILQSTDLSWPGPAARPLARPSGAGRGGGRRDPTSLC